MKLLVLTQKIDETDDILGFFHDWIVQFSKAFDQVTVICLERGVSRLPSNARLFSLGKEEGGTFKIVRYIVRFYRYIWREKKNYDAVFVHMNPEYVILGGPLWHFWGKKIALWYNHRKGGFRVNTAALFADHIFYTSLYAYTRSFKKARQMPAGIDLEKFNPPTGGQNAKIPMTDQNPKIRLLSLGRISPVKHIEVIIEALQKLDNRGIDYIANIYGNPTNRDYRYYETIRTIAKPLEDKGKIVFHQAVPNHETPAIYGAHDIFINATPQGSFDKTVLEAALGGAIPIVGNVSFADIFPRELFFKEGNAADLAMTLERLLVFSSEQREGIRKQLRAAVTEKHSLTALVHNVLAILGDMSLRITYIANVRFPTGKAHGIQIAKMCEALVARGVNLTLVVPRKGKADDPFSFYGLTKTFRVKRIWALNIAPSTRAGFLLSAISFALSSFVYLLMHRERDITYSIDIDNISFLGVLFSGRPCFFEMHAPRKRTLLNQLWFGRIAGAIAINNRVKETLETNFPALKGNILIAPNGVDFSRYAALLKISTRKQLELPESAKIIVYTGSFQGWKGLETIIRAAHDLASFQFYLVGGTEKDLRCLGFTGNISPNVHFKGKRDFKEMPLWHTSADVLLVTGTKKDEYSYNYTSPMKLFEYMAAQRPIVASQTPAIEQIVSEREVFFHEPDDSGDLKGVIEYIYKNPDQAYQRAQNAYRKAGEFSWDNRAKEILNFISERL